MIQRPASRLLVAILLLAAQIWVTLAGASEAEHAPPAKREFRVYDGLLFLHKPDLSKLGMLPAYGTGNLWSGNASPDQPDEATIRRVMTENRNLPGIFYVDIEHWVLYGVPEQQLDANIAKFERVADLVRESAPNLTYGFYGMMPENQYWPIVAGTPEQLQAWREVARRTEVIANKVDVILPSLYTFYDSEADRADWRKWAPIILTEARRYHKPVYAFLWPEFHESNKKLMGHAVPGDYWRMELGLVHQYADGIVIWGGYQKEWDENAPWWQETKRFLAMTHR